MAGISFIMHNAKRMLYLDFSNMNMEQFFESLEKAKAMISSEPEKSVLTLVNVKGGKFDTKVSGALKEFVKSNTPYIKATAVYGVEGLMDIIFKSILAVSGRKNLVSFTDLDKAKDYLSGQK